MEDFSFEISIPCDDDGFVLLQCPKCGEFFKLRPSDIESDEVLDIYCPLCGLTSEEYFTQDVIDLAIAMTKNKALDELYSEFRSLERQTRNSFVQFKCSKWQLQRLNLISKLCIKLPVAKGISLSYNTLARSLYVFGKSRHLLTAPKRQLFAA